MSASAHFRPRTGSDTNCNSPTQSIEILSALGPTTLTVFLLRFHPKRVSIRTTCPVRLISRTATRVFFFSQLFFLPVAVFSLFSGETAHRRLHHTGSPSPRERGRKKKREEEEEERGRKKKKRREERGRKKKKRREEEEAEKQRRKEEEERGRKKKKKQSCEKASPEEEIGFVGEERGMTEEELKKKHVSLCDWWVAHDTWCGCRT
ncbi:hypothetical protein ACLB2K_077432 [Fragaria x ananassa]